MQFRKRSMRWAVVTLVVAASTPLFAQDDAAPAAAEPAGAPAREVTPQETAFTRAAQQMGAMESSLRAMITEAQTASAERRAELQKEFDAARGQLAALIESSIDLAIDALPVMPTREGAPAQFLMGAAQGSIGNDQYELGLKCLSALFDADIDDPVLHELAGIALYSLDRFEEAKTHFDRVKEAGRFQLQPALDRSNEVEAAIGHWEDELAIRAAEAAADDLPRVKIETSAGDIVVELYENEAPNTVANFVHLVETGYYNGTIFHRVLPTFMAQGGDPTGTGTGGPGWSIACECYTDNFRRHFRGTLSMAHAGRDTGGSQFFLTFRATPHLDGKHTVFGRVIEGLDVLQKIQRRDPRRGGPSDKIVTATVLRKRDHAYVPVKGASAR